jgi:hypothetical protein
LYDFLIVTFFSEGNVYLGIKPLSVRLSQWIYLMLMIVTGYLIIIGRRNSWYIYQLVGVTIIVERLLIYFLLFELFSGTVVRNFLLPLLAGAFILLFTNRKQIRIEFNLERKEIQSWLFVSLCFGALVTLLPKSKFIISLLL